MNNNPFPNISKHFYSFLLISTSILVILSPSIYAYNSSASYTLKAGDFSNSGNAAETISYRVTTSTGATAVFEMPSANYYIKAGLIYLIVSDPDITPPTGAIKINNDNQYAVSTSVALNLSASDNTGGSGIDKMQFSNDNVNWSAPEAYSATKTWTLSSGDDTKTVYAKFSDKADNWSVVINDSIILDTTPPAIIITSPVDGFITSVSNITVSYTVDSVSKDKAFTLTEGSNTLTIAESDPAGNSTAKSIKVTLDTVAPVITITSGPQGTIDYVNVGFSYSATDLNGISGYSCWLDSNSPSSWSTDTSVSYTNLTEGPHSFFIKAKDPAGNISQAQRDFNIKLDKPPILEAIGDKSTDENKKIEFTITASDPDNDTLTYSASSLPQGSAFDANAHKFSWTPNFLQAGVYSVTFSVSDAKLSVSETIHITVNDVDLPDGLNNYEIKGITFASWFNGEYQDPASDQSLINLCSTGANYVGLLGTWYMDTQNGEWSRSNIIYSHPQKTPSDDDLIHAINAAKHLKRKTFLKLHVRVILSESPWRDAWAGNIYPLNTDEWFNNYIPFVEHYAQLCQDNGVDIFCFGTELNSMTRPENAAQWDRVIDAIKARYTGKITFSSNMYDEYQRIPFWARCDYLGIGPYFSLTTSIANPDLDTIVNGWSNSLVDVKIINNLEFWQKQYNKPVIFTEIGYCSVDTSPYAPWKGTGNYPENWPLQKRCYDALFLALQNKVWFAGAFWWDWLCDPSAGTSGLSRKDYTPQNKDAEESLKNFYLGIDPSRISYIKITDGIDNEVPDDTPLYAGRYKNLYARAYDSTNKILGYALCAWSVSNNNAALVSNNVGFSVLTATAEGNVKVTATDANNHSDSATFVISRKYLNVPSEYPTIQAAMDSSTKGDIINVSAGEYNESIDIKDGVSLIGIEGAKNTVIKGGLKFLTGTNENTVLQGFTVTNANGDGIYSAWTQVGTPIIRNNIIKNNLYTGIDLEGGSSPKIYNNIIEGNLAGGIYISFGSPEIINNVIVNNSNAGDGGGMCVFHSRGKVFNNIVINNYASGYGGGIKGWGNDPEFEIGYNDVWNNTTGTGAEINYGTCDPGAGAISVDPGFLGADYFLSGSSPCKDTGNPDIKYNDLDGSRNDMGVYGGPLSDPAILSMPRGKLSGK